HGIYERLQRLGLAYYDRTPTGAIISRMMDDVGAIQGFVSGQTVTILTDLGTTVAVGGVLAWQDWRLALVALAFVPLYLLSFRSFLPRIRSTSGQIRRKMDRIFGHLKERIDGVQVIKVHARERAEEGEF